MKAVLASILFFISSNLFAQTQQKFIVNFDYNKSFINAEAALRLDSFIRSAPIASINKINLFGHTDSIGNNEYNDKLSLSRVEAVKNYLASKGVTSVAFEIEKGYGKHNPVKNNETEASRYFNRRVEITVTRNNDYKDTSSQSKNPSKNPTAKDKLSDSSLTKKITDTSTKVGTNIILNNLNFVGGKHVLLPQSVPIVLELLKVLKDNPKIEIEIQGHVCCAIGAEDGLDIETGTYNLSENRARAVYEYLIDKGIAQSRLSYKGFAHQFPLVYPEDTEAKKTINRRVEIKILKK
jgi:outer membrane protein OmpA-like peptidoglycan-associated protein